MDTYTHTPGVRFILPYPLPLILVTAQIPLHPQNIAVLQHKQLRALLPSEAFSWAAALSQQKQRDMRIQLAEEKINH
jgi:hypothetical protein